MENKSKLISIKEAANMLGVTPLTLRNWDNSGKLKASRHPINNYRVYKRDDIERFIEEISLNVTPKPHRLSKNRVKKLEVKHLDN